MSAKEKPKPTPTPEQRKAADPQHSVWVAASAGSGKTQVLVDRVIRLMLDGAAPDAILCLTFTKAAAAEMSNRLFKRLSEWIGLDDEALNEDLTRLGLTGVDVKKRNAARRLFARALETPGGLKIQTIHAFCERLLQLFPVESGMAPGFRVIEEQETKALFHRCLMQALSDEDKSTQAAWQFLDDGSVASFETLEKLVTPFLSGSNGMRRRLSDFAKLPEGKAALAKVLEVTNDRELEDIGQEICDIDVDAYKTAAAGFAVFEADAKFRAHDFLLTAAESIDPDERLNALTSLLFTTEKKQRGSLLRKAVGESQPALAQWLEVERQRLLDLFECLAKQQLYEANRTIYGAMAGIMARVNLAKRAQGLYDFDDLINKASALLEGHEAAQWVLYKLDKGLTHILVDEAQDTSPAQWTIIKALAGEFFTDQIDVGIKRTVFAVGDLKQSIYSFQGADIAAFEAARKSFEQILADVEDPLQEIDLSISYRSNQLVLDVVDEVFASGRDARVGFGPRAELERPHTAFAKDRLGLVELWDVMLPDEKLEHDNWRAPVDHRSNRHPRLKLAERIARIIKSWIGTREIAGQAQVVGAGDILILLQSRNDLFHALLGALRRHGIPVAGADRLSLQNSMIVKDLLMLGQFIRMPMDDHALACILKSPLVPEPLNEDQLFALAYDRGTTAMLNRLAPETANARWLHDICQSFATPYMLFAKVLREARQRMLERLGQEADDAAQEFLTLALDYEQKHGTSLTGFLDWLSDGDTQIKRDMEPNAGLVRLMTVHGAKGLEAPIVFLADAADPPPQKKDRLLKVTEAGPLRGMVLFEPELAMALPVVEKLKADAKREALNERLRLLYVGMTRAADELYICGSLNRDDDAKVNAESWYPHIKFAVLENAALSDGRRVEGHDGFGLIRFGAEPVFAATKSLGPSQIEALPDWISYQSPLALQHPTIAVAARNSDAFDKKAVEEGLATHKLIEMMADAPLEQRLKVGQSWASRLKLDGNIAPRLHALLQKPELTVFFTEFAQSEVGIGGEDGLRGRVDRMVILENCVYLLDYKTNRSPPRHVGPDHVYAQQMAGYARLLSQAYPGHAVKAALLWTQTGEVMWLSSEVLSRAIDMEAKATA